MFKRLNHISSFPTLHGVGQKRMLLTAEETDSSITQIAVTTLMAGEVVEEHQHITMEECFFFLAGVAELTVNGEVLECREGDFVQVKCGEPHRLEAVTDIEVVTVGVAMDNESERNN